MELSSKKGVPYPPLPLLPSPPIFKKDEKFKNFLLSKSNFYLLNQAKKNFFIILHSNTYFILIKLIVIK